MKKISLWGRQNPWPARYLIIASHFLLCALALLNGILLQQLGVVIPTGAYFVFAGIYLLAFMAYPFRVQKGREYSAAAYYFRQKTCDYALLVTGFFGVLFFANRPEKMLSLDPVLHAAAPYSSAIPSDSTVKKYKTIAEFSASMKDVNGFPLKWKEKKKLLREQVRAIKQDKYMSDGAKVGLIILSVAVALGLLFLVAALSCNLSCDGQGGAAALVLIGGLGLIIFLSIITIRAILGKKKRKKLSGIEPAPPEKKE